MYKSYFGISDVSSWLWVPLATSVPSSAIVKLIKYRKNLENFVYFVKNGLAPKLWLPRMRCLADIDTRACSIFSGIHGSWRLKLPKGALKVTDSISQAYWTLSRWSHNPIAVTHYIFTIISKVWQRLLTLSEYFRELVTDKKCLWIASLQIPFYLKLREWPNHDSLTIHVFSV